MYYHFGVFYDLLQNFKTGNLIIDTIIMSIGFSLLTNLSHSLPQYCYNAFNELNSGALYNYFKPKCTITISGKVIIKPALYNCMDIETKFSNNFRALWFFIEKKLLSSEDTDIFSVKEYPCKWAPNKHFSKKNGERHKEKQFRSSIYIVDQYAPFLLCDKLKIYAKVRCKNENVETKDKSIAKIENVVVEVFSSVSTVFKINNFIKQISDDYNQQVNHLRYDKLFIYDCFPIQNRDLDTNFEWKEYMFESTRNFDNLFFSEKNNLIRKVDFFQNNKEWYEKHGIPYTLGIGLSGPPGTGKTSIIKALANKLKRHIVIISLSKISTISDLCNLFFEERYTTENSEKSITFDKKIIVFEDIDCMTDIILSRFNSNIDNTDIIDNNKKAPPNIISNSDSNSSESKLNDILLKIIKTETYDEPQMNSILKNYTTKNDKLTLSFLLNLIDGIRETPGRILIITSNLYDKIDEALLRPGRIDITLQLTKVSKQILNQIYYNFFNTHLTTEQLKNYTEYKFTPAEIINLCINSESSDDFLRQLYNN